VFLVRALQSARFSSSPFAGMAAGLLIGLPTLLITPVEQFEPRAHPGLVLFAICSWVCVSGLLLGARLGLAAETERDTRGVTSLRRLALVAGIALILVDVCVSPLLVRHMRSVKDMLASREVNGILYKIRVGKPWGVRYQAAHAYAKLDPSNALRHPIKQVRYIAAIDVAATGDLSAVPVLVEAVNDRNWPFIPPMPVWDPACVALGNLGDARALPGLVKLLQSTNHLDRRNAVNALSRIPDPRAQAILRQVPPIAYDGAPPAFKPYAPGVPDAPPW
jgi:hypothetical protein